MEGIFSIDIKIFGLLKPNILICFLPEIPSEKLTSIDGVVSKLSARLQHAAFNNSSEDIFKTFAELNRETEDDLVLYLMETASNSASAFNIILVSNDLTLTVSF